MDTSKAKHQKLPSREIAYAYAVAMNFAQRFEENLRTILYAGRYLEKGEALHLTPEEIWRLKSKEGFIETSTCGDILKKLRKSPLIKGNMAQDALAAFKNACLHRNELAHWFLAEQNFNKMTSKREKEVIRELHGMSLDLYKAYQLSHALCHQAEYHADEHHRIDQQMLRKLMLEDAPQDILKQFMGDEVRHVKPRRRYGTRKKR